MYIYFETCAIPINHHPPHEPGIVQQAINLINQHPNASIHWANLSERFESGPRLAADAGTREKGRLGQSN